MANNWETIWAIRLTEPQSAQHNHVVARIVTIGGTALMLDLREMMYNFPTKTGVAFHLPELKWINKLFSSAEEGWIQTPYRTLTVTKLFYGTRFTVEKKNIRQEILLSEEAMTNLKTQLFGILSSMEERAKKYDMETEFNEINLINEKIPCKNLYDKKLQNCTENTPENVTQETMQI